LGDGPELPAVSPARLLADDGYTLAEIAERLSVTEGDVLRDLAADGRPFIGAAHVTRAESAMVARAVGMRVPSERVTATGDVVTVMQTLAPDPVAGKLLLSAHRPEVYGDAAVRRSEGGEASLELLAHRIVALTRAKREGVTLDAERPALVAPTPAEGENSSGGNGA
jgi:hypothetical protein